MPSQHRLSSRRQQQRPLTDKSLSRDGSTTLRPSKDRPAFLDIEYQKVRPRGDRDHTKKDKTHTKRPLEKENICRHCLTLKDKLSEREDQLRQIISVHRQQMGVLQQSNLQLRQEMETLEERAKGAEIELERLKDLQSSISLGIQTQYDHFPTLSAVGEPKGLTSLKKFVQEQKSTFSELLVVTPQPSQLGTSPFQIGQKQNALRSQFQRLMSECSQTSSRSRKTTLRRQLTAIADQLSVIQSTTVVV